VRLPPNVRIALLAVAAVLVLAAAYQGLLVAEVPEGWNVYREPEMFRTMFFHVASAWVAYLAFGATFAGSAMYLRSKRLEWDALAASSAEVGVVFCTVAIVSGSLFAKGTWDVYWLWDDLKLMMTLALWLVFVAYLGLRANTPSRLRRASLGAVFSALGVLCIPLSFAANRIWVTTHPTVIASSEGSIGPGPALALVLSVLGFTFLYVHVLAARLEVEHLRDELESLKQRAGD
jgi:heme exporter protein C